MRGKITEQISQGYRNYIDYAKAFDHVDHNRLWKILKEMGIPDYLTCLLRNLMQVRKQQLELDMEQDWFQIGKGVCQGCILSPCLFNLYAKYIRRRKWQPTLVFLPGESRGQGSLMGCCP